MKDGIKGALETQEVSCASRKKNVVKEELKGDVK